MFCHFCVDNDFVSMTTQLKGSKTRFLPFNKGIDNPIVDGDYRTQYLWNEILTPNSPSQTKRVLPSLLSPLGCVKG